MIDVNRTFEIHASPHITNVRCPKHHIDMKELQDGWFSSAWWCGKCEYPYRLQLVKVKKFDLESIQKQLKPKPNL